MDVLIQKKISSEALKIFKERSTTIESTYCVSRVEPNLWAGIE